MGVVEFGVALVEVIDRLPQAFEPLPLHSMRRIPVDQRSFRLRAFLFGSRWGKAAVFPLAEQGDREA